MHIALLGAAGGEVTGSAYLIETQMANVLAFETLAASRPRLILTHGEDRARTALKQAIKDRHALLECPALYDVIEF